MSINPIPAGYHTVTPYLIVADVDVLMSFLEAAWGGVRSVCSTDEQGRVTHGEVKVGDSNVMMGRAPTAGDVREGMLYLITKDPAYAQKAWSKIDRRKPRLAVSIICA